MSRLRAEMLSIGTELLLGQVVDTNAAYISERLAQLGIDLYFRHTVGDNRLRLAAVLSHALVRSDIVITSGGLGPTQDDLTKEVVAGLFAEPLEERPEAVRHIEEVLARAGRPVSQNNLRQALFPPSAELIPNPVGTAPGMWLEREGRLIICLPGVPAELKAMMEQTVVPRLAERRGGGLLRSRTLRFFGIGESALEEAIADLIEAQSNPTIAPYAGTGDVKVRLTARASSEAEALSLIEPVEVEIRSRLGAYLYGYDDDTLEGVVGRHLRSRGWRLAVAESCTGGLVSHLLTNVPGSSDYLLESVVAYSNEAKERRLGVPADLIAAHGAVSEEVARAMAEGARRSAQADVGLAVTGIAGPGGGGGEKPVGLVHMAVSTAGETAAERHLFRGDRQTVKARSAAAALHLLFKALVRSQGA